MDNKLKILRVLNEKFFKRFKHDWETIKTSIGRSNFVGIAGDHVPNVRVKGVLEKCSKCDKERAYVEDGHGTKYPIDPKKMK